MYIQPHPHLTATLLYLWNLSLSREGMLQGSKHTGLVETDNELNTHRHP